MGIRVLRGNAPAGSLANRSGLLRRRMHQVNDHFLTGSSNQNLLAGIQKMIDTRPGIADDASARPCSFEDSCRRREAISSHAFPRNVQHGPWRTVERIMIAGVDVAQVSDVPQAFI